MSMRGKGANNSRWRKRSAVLDHSVDLLKQRSHELFGGDLALGDAHCSAGLHERHIGDADDNLVGFKKLGNERVRDGKRTLMAVR